MIPLRDTLPHRRFPLVNYALVALCTAGFVWELLAGPELEELIQTWGLIPARFLALGQGVGFHLPELYVPLVTSTFLHAGGLHFASNMLFLWIFGPKVEDRMGHTGYPLFYLGGGVVAGLAHVAAHPTSVIPTLGASGSIAAVMGAYFLLYPRAWVISVVPPFFWLQFPIPAVIYLAFWFVTQLHMGSLALAGDPAQAGVAWWAHAGGFAFGALTVIFIGRRPRREA